MEEKITPETPRPQQDPNRLRYVMLVVLIICGGNGLGIVSAALIWKLSGALAASILTAVGITILALIGAMLLIISHNKKQK